MSNFSQRISISHHSPFAIAFVCYLLLQMACTADPPPTLNYKDREVVDSLFRANVDTLKPMLDSFCALRHDSAVQHKVDSMMEERQSEIDRYLKRLKKDQE